MRKAFAFICYLISLGALGVCGYVTWLAYNGDIARTKGFLIFLPIWIGAYWFITFFTQLGQTKTRSGDFKWIINRYVGGFLSFVNNVLSTGLMGFWIYIYIFREVGGIENFFK